MPEESFEERTEDASPKKKREAREKGNVAKSTEVNSVLVLLTGIIIIRIMASTNFNLLAGGFADSFRLAANPVMTPEYFVGLFRHFVIIFFKVALPICIGIMTVGLLANIMQIGFLLTTKPLEPKLEKINPLSGLQRMFGLRSIVEAVKSILKMSVIALVAYMTISGEFDKIMTLNSASIGGFWLFLLLTGFKIVIRVAMILVIIAILDYSYQFYEHNKKLKMTKQEVKEERKQMDGDPQVKARIRSLQREMARRRMMEEVPKATVVVTNPTHLAIAIRYEPAEMETPLVIAKGKMVIAEKIKEKAKDAGIPVVEDKPLARAMFDQVEPGDEIPYEFFNAVAEILAYVYKLKGKEAA